MILFWIIILAYLWVFIFVRYTCTCENYCYLFEHLRTKIDENEINFFSQMLKNIKTDFHKFVNSQNLDLTLRKYLEILSPCSQGLTQPLAVLQSKTRPF